MQQMPEITLRDIPHSDAVEAHIREKIDKLAVFSSMLISCHVVVELTQKDQHTGNLHNVHLRLFVPGKEIVATRNGDPNLYKAIQDAFDDARIQLTSYSDQMHRKVKAHPIQILGKVVRLFPEDDFGFIEGPDGNEYYFHANNVASNNFHQLKVGMDVHFIEAMGEGGPQARRVTAKV